MKLGMPEAARSFKLPVRDHDSSAENPEARASRFKYIGIALSGLAALATYKGFSIAVENINRILPL